MYKPKKHIRLSSLFQAPKLADIRTLFTEGSKAKGCTVELPWVNKRTGINYSLTVRAEISGGQPMWTLYEGEGQKSRVVWSSPFEDVDLLYDVLTLSIPEEALPLGTRETPKPDPEKIREAESRQAYAAEDANAQLLTPKQPASFYEEGLLKEEELETYKRAESKRAAEEERERKREELVAKEIAAQEKLKAEKNKDKEKDEKQSDQAPQAPPPHPGMPYGSQCLIRIIQSIRQVMCHHLIRTIQVIRQVIILILHPVRPCHQFHQCRLHSHIRLAQWEWARVNIQFQVNMKQRVNCLLSSLNHLLQK